MNKWLVLVVFVLLVLTASMGLKSLSAPSLDRTMIGSPSPWVMAPTSAPPPAVPWGR